MPKPISQLSLKLGARLDQAVAAHANDILTGSWEEVGQRSRRQDLRDLAELLDGLKHDSPEMRAWLKSLGKGPEIVSPRLLQIVTRHFYNMSDRADASAAFDLPWAKRGSDNRSIAIPKYGLNARRLSEIPEEIVSWFWNQRIPSGAITLLIGDPDLGKTWTVLDAFARVTTHRGFHDSPNPFNGPRDVLFITAEDDFGKTIRPRFRMLGGDCSRFHGFDYVYKKDKEQGLDLTDHLPEVDEYLFQHPMIAAVALDPISAFLGKIDTHRNSDVRNLFTPLKQLAEKHQVAIIGINHLAKGDGEKAMYRSIGSIAFVAAARSSLLVSADPQVKDRRLLTKIKCNLQTEDVGGLAYRVGPNVPGGFLWEEGVVKTTADETLRQPPRNDTRAPARSEAKAWLLDVLKDGPVHAADVWGKAKADGVNRATLQAAQKELGVVTQKTGGKGAGWLWTLPPSSPLGP